MVQPVVIHFQPWDQQLKLAMNKQKFGWIKVAGLVLRIEKSSGTIYLAQRGDLID